VKVVLKVRTEVASWIYRANLQTSEDVLLMSFVIRLVKEKNPSRYPAGEPALQLVRELVYDLLASWLQTC